MNVVAAMAVNLRSPKTASTPACRRMTENRTSRPAKRNSELMPSTAAKCTIRPSLGNITATINPSSMQVNGAGIRKRCNMRGTTSKEQIIKR
jgi:hypothetical protein